MAIVAIMLALIFLLLCLFAGMADISMQEYMVIAGGIITLNLTFYGIIRSGLNLRFKDPSLTMVQWGVMITLFSYIVFNSHPIRSAVMTGYILTNLFGIFQFSRKEYVFATMFPLVQYGAIILWEANFPPANYNLGQNIIQWLILVGALSWVAIIGSYIRAMREKVKNSKIKLLESHEEISKQRDGVKQSRDKLQETLTKLTNSHGQMEAVNLGLMESLHYAEGIQRSLLPETDRLKTSIPDSFFLWMPKDIVGGDIFFTYRDEKGFIIVLMDCTGQGVPGAFMTMIAYSEARKIILDEACHDPAEILKNLNQSMKTILKKDTDHSISDEGLDAAVCRVNSQEKTITYAGAGIPLFYRKDGTSNILKGDRHSLGFKDSDPEFRFTNHTISVHEQGSFYLTSNGYLNQPGHQGNHPIGVDGFQALMENHSHLPYDVQRKEILQSFLAHQGDHEQADDVTVIGFGM